jgi:hypothetical protein
VGDAIDEFAELKVGWSVWHHVSQNKKAPGAGNFFPDNRALWPLVVDYLGALAAICCRSEC